MPWGADGARDGELHARRHPLAEGGGERRRRRRQWPQAEVALVRAGDPIERAAQAILLGGRARGVRDGEAEGCAGTTPTCAPKARRQPWQPPFPRPGPQRAPRRTPCTRDQHNHH